MKKNSLRIILMSAVLVTLSVSYASAQSAGEQTANIPFAFNVGDKTFPAGEYSVKRVNPQSDRPALAIRSADGSTSKIVLTTPVQSSKVREDAKLVFNRYGGQYFLSQVLSPAENGGLEIPQSGTERRLAKGPDGAKPERQTVALNSRLR